MSVFPQVMADTDECLSAADLQLLCRFEPILCFNRGEQFYPMDVARYVSACQLCVQRPNEEPQVLIPRGKLTLDDLSHIRRDVPGAIYFLHFVEPLPPGEVQQFRRTSTLREFQAGRGRLARVGLISRIGDLLFSVSLLLRGRVPGGSAAAAALRYAELRVTDDRPYYYARIVRQHGYVALQYWFFYAFNDWRSSFNGVNDHEADWEMITVYAVEQPDGQVTPAWLGYSSHEFEGDDLRRRWDDPDLQFSGEHPLVFVAAGAHANYFFPGEYLLAAEVPYTQGLMRTARWIQSFWKDTLRQSSQRRTPGESGLVRIPFVDYARGDGLRIGPGQAYPWTQRLLQSTCETPAPAWVDNYSGLWGLYTGDLLEGENAPARPKYHRNGTVQRMWYDPVGWCGLDKVPTPDAIRLELEKQRERLIAEQQQLDVQVMDRASYAAGLELEIGALQQLAMPVRGQETRRRMRVVENELEQLKERRAANQLILEQLARYDAHLAAGERGSPRAHLRYPQLPASSDDLRLGRLAETWSAVSIGVLLVGTVILANFTRHWQIGVLAMLGVYAFMEALFRRQIQTLVRTLVAGLAIVTALILVYEFFWLIVAMLALGAGLLVIIENVRELRRSDP